MQLKDNGRRSFIIRHWRGELPVQTAFGAVFLLFAVLLFPAIFSAIRLIPFQEDTLFVSARIDAAVIICKWIVLIWATVGAWRASRPWVAVPFGAVDRLVATRVLIVAVCVVLGKVWLVSDFKALSFLRGLLAGADELGVVESAVVKNSKTLQLTGYLGAGSFEVVKKSLKAHPEIEVVKIESLGGRHVEAVKIAQLLQEMKINTRVEKLCESACTVVFLAGTVRSATPRTLFGFHSATVTGDPSAAYDVQATLLMSETYRQFGVPEEFIAKVAKVPPDDMYYPTISELQRVGIVSELVQ
jgi:hypothetical protein